MELFSHTSQQLHVRTIQSLVLTGDAVVSASSDGSLASWTKVNGELVEVSRKEAAHGKERVTGLCALGKSQVASIGFDGFVRIWTIPALELSKDLPSGLPANVRLFAVKASKSFIVASGGDDGKTSKGCFSVWQMARSDSPKVEPWAHQDNIYGLALEEPKPGSRRVCAKLWTGGRDGVLQMYDVFDGPAVNLLKRVSVGSSIRSLCVSVEAKAVWCGTSGGVLHVFSTDLSTPSLTLPVHDGALYEIICAKASQHLNRTELLTCGKDFRLCSITGSVAPNKKRRGRTGSVHELVLQKPKDQEEHKPAPFLESMCLNVQGNRLTAFVGARDGRVLIAELQVTSTPSTPTSPLKRPATLRTAVKRPASVVTQRPSKRRPAGLLGRLAKRPAARTVSPKTHKS